MKFICGGQTGVDRGMLDACLEEGFPCGGWCPDGRKAEDGVIEDKYPLRELAGADYIDRTLKSVEDSHGTIILYSGNLLGGTLASLNFAKKIPKPHILIDESQSRQQSVAEEILSFLSKNEIEIANWSGPRASEWEGAYTFAKEVTLSTINSLR